LEKNNNNDTMTKNATLYSMSLLALASMAVADCEQSTLATWNNFPYYIDAQNGHMCRPYDCGGGRAPVKSSVVGCHAYTGTEVMPAIFPGWTPAAAVASVVPATTVVQVSATPAATLAASTSAYLGTFVPPVSSSSIASVGAGSSAPATTQPATLSSKIQAQVSGNSTSSKTTSASPSAQKTNGGNVFGYSLGCIALGAIGAVALL
jgi:hypothetical protein